MISKDEFLELYPFLNNDALIDEILNVSTIKKMPVDEILIDLGQGLHSFPLIIKGSIKILREDNSGNEVFLYFVDSGNTCAATIACCIGDKKSSIRAVVEEDAVFLSVPIHYMDNWIKKYDIWRSYIFQSFSNRFNDMLHAIDQLAFHKMDQRILNYLQDTSDINQNKIISISHQQIAIDLNTSREVVSRLLKQLEIEGILKLGRGKIELI